MFFFFFKQKTAYEMRISDWSSDVCSSDLFHVRVRRGAEAAAATYGSRDGNCKRDPVRRPAMRRSDLRTDRHKRKNGLYSTYDRERLAQIGTASLNLSSQTAFENNGMMGLFQPMQSAPDKLKPMPLPPEGSIMQDRKSTRLNSRH